MPRFRPVFGASWEKDFAWLWGGSAVSMLGSAGRTSAFPLILFALTSSPAVVGWAVTLTAVPGLLSYLPAGVVVDRYDRRAIMIVSQVLRVLAALLLAAVVVGTCGGPLAWSVLFVAVLVEGACKVFYGTAEVAVIPNVVRHTPLPSAVATNEARNHMAVMAGRPLGGFLFVLGPAWPAAFEAASHALSLAALRRLGPAIGAGAKHARGPARASWSAQLRRFLGEVREGISVVWKEPLLRVALVVCAVTNCLFQTVALFMIVYLRDDGYPDGWLALMFAAPGVGGVLGSMTAPHFVERLLKRGHLPLMVWCLGIWIATGFLLCLSHHWSLYFTAWALVGFAGAHMNVALNSYRLERLRADQRGRVHSATMFFVGGVPVVLGPALGGHVVALYGARNAAWILLCVLVLLAVCVMVHGLCVGFREREFSARRVRRPRAAEPDPVGAPAGVGAAR